MKGNILMVIMVTGMVAAVHDTECTYNCPYNYDPVCGTDGNTYPNLCVLEGEKECHNLDLTVDHKGECGKECPYGCGGLWDPVCGSDGKTYSNMCQLNVTSICYDPDLTLDHKGECDKECPYSCTDEYVPVCGSDGKTYPNICELNVAKECYDPELTLDHQGECGTRDTECPYACTDEYDPVCGSDGRTYPNMCELNLTITCYNPDLTLDHKGECGTTDPDCPVICTAEYVPVCGSDGKTYGNMCELEAEKKCHNSDLTLAYTGECESDCPRNCYEMWDPVCGTDGKTYGNLCELENARDCLGKPDLTVDYNGECKATPR